MWALATWRAVALAVPLALLLAEGALRIFNPVDVRIRESEIRLPVNKKIVYRNPGSAKLDREIVCARNILGFRGSNPPENFEDHLTVVTVGGSTTECRYLTDGKTWPDRLGARLAEKFERVWLNNAGMDGQSTFGNIILLKQVLLDLEPDYLVFMLGSNDADRTDLNRRDVHMIGKRTVVGRVVDSSELLSTVRALARTRRHRERILEHVFDLDLTQLETREVSPEESERRLELNRNRQAVAAYRARLNQMIVMTRRAGIEPILVTEPTLFGEGIDPTTGVELGPLAYGLTTSAQVWMVLEIYHDVTRAVGRAHDVLVVDLARELAKDSAYFYDWTHYTNEGAERIAEILSRELEPFLASRGHSRKPSIRSRQLPAERRRSSAGTREGNS